MKTFAAIFAAALLSGTALAQSQTQTQVTAIALQSIKETSIADTKEALAALEAGDFQLASTHLRNANANANRLSLQSLTQKLALNTPSFQPEDSRFSLANSSTIQFENFIKNSGAVERRFKDDTGRVVTVRVFGEDRDLEDFTFIRDDAAMLEKGKLELAEMRGEQAIKRRGEDGELSVLMMSEKDHALIEIEGDSEETVMAFIDELETADQ